MSEWITAENIDQVIQKNKEIKEEVLSEVLTFQRNQMAGRVVSMQQLAWLILEEFGLVQMPIEDKFWSGAIYVKDGKIIPVINTAQPRANQYFTAWHEIYHLIFDNVSFDHFIENDNLLEERKAECFAASILLSGVEEYYKGLKEMDFMTKIFWCMSVFQVPYKAVLVSLYESAVYEENENLKDQIRRMFDYRFINLSEQFRAIGLDDSLVLPSYVVNVSALQKKIRRKEEENPELRYHKENEHFLENIRNEAEMIAGRNK